MKIEEILFIVTFYFTVVRAVSHTHLFSNWALNNWDDVLFANVNWPWLRIPCVVINWAMWFYQIWFWMNLIS